MGWIKKGQLVIPDGNSDPGVGNVDGQQVTPSGIVVEKIETDVPTIAPPPPREIRQLVKIFTKREEKKRRKEANKRFLAERFGYLRQPIPKHGTATSGIKGDK
jgi:hypothetical protein